MPILHYIPLVVQLLRATLGETNLSEKTGTQVRPFERTTEENASPTFRRAKKKKKKSSQNNKAAIPQNQRAGNWMRWKRENNTLEMKINTRFCEVSLDT